MAKAEYIKKYEGKAAQQPRWKVFSEIFDEIWGSEMRSLPSYPNVIGGVSASWINEGGIKFTAESLEEIKDAYIKGDVSKIVIISLVGEPYALLIYYVKDFSVSFEIKTGKYEIADSAIFLIKKYFPITDTPITNTNVEKVIPKVDKKILKRKLINNRWYQKWWVQLLLTLIIAVLSGLILKWL